LRLDNSSKAVSSSFMFLAWSKLWSMKSIMSFAYYRIDRPSSIMCEITPNIFPSVLALLIRIANMSTTMIKGLEIMGLLTSLPFLFGDLDRVDH
jgi:hypothetical protein